MNTPRATKDWIKAVAAYLNLSLSELAVKSGLSPSTVTRYMNDNSGKLTITDRTLDAIAVFSGVAKNVMPGQQAVPGLGEGEAMPYDTQGPEKLPEWVEAAVKAAVGTRNGVAAWIAKNWALDMLGVVPGDVVLIDQNKRPKPGDIVCVQLRDLATGSTETVLRRYDPPYVTTHSAKSGPSRPEVIDDMRVSVVGVETGLIRPRH
jgi:transcriptional regulator with XRE-family HTH domain